MPDTDAHTSRTVPPNGNGAASVETADRRRPSAARFSFEPDPRLIRTLLHEIEVRLAHDDFRLKRKIRLLVGEIVARLMTSSAGLSIELAIEAKPDSVRIDIWDNSSEPSDFFDRLDETVFNDLTTAWGPDRRRACGAWFEVAIPAAD